MRVDEAYIVSHFDKALEEGRITAYFQPIYRTMTGQVCAAEALARWEDPEKGLLTPPEFIDVLERHHMIYRLDLAILRRACECYCRLRQAGVPVHAFSVNFSRLDFGEPDLFRRVAGILEQYDVPHQAIKIEITESVMLENPERFREMFDALRAAGFTVWIDDFGSGFSSLNVLQAYNFDLLKIDMLFLRNFNQRSRQVISSVVSLAKTLGIHTLAEGVENEEQLRFLKSIGCETVQGFLYSKPLDEAAFQALLTPAGVETQEDTAYWNAAGRFDLLSPNPLEAFQPAAAPAAEGGDTQFHSEIPLALIECAWEGTYYVYASDEYLARIQSLGFASIDNVEHAFNDKVSAMYGPLRSLILEAIARSTIQEMDYVTRDVYYKFRVRCIAKTKAKAMIAASLRTFDSEQEAQQRSELMQYSQALYATYEHVTVIFPGKDASERIFSRANFQTAHQLVSLREGIRSFCEKEVCPEDQARYMRFFDLDTLAERAAQAEAGFLQQPFRINGDDGQYVWRMIRITKIPSVLEDMYLYTIQKLPDSSVKIAELLIREHPEMME